MYILQVMKPNAIKFENRAELICSSLVPNEEYRGQGLELLFCPSCYWQLLLTGPVQNILICPFCAHHPALIKGNGFEDWDARR